MKCFALFCLFALVAIAGAQENEVKFVIDPFTAQSDTIVVLIPSGGVVTPLVQTNFISSSTVMGGERDLQLTVTGGSGNLVLTTGVSGGVYTSATPNEARGNSLLQIDGPDTSMTVNTSGLFNHPNNNFMNEDAFAFRVLIESDLPGNIIFRVFSGGAANTFCSVVIPTPGDDTLNTYIIPYTDFTGTCDFSNIGALEIFTPMADNIDVLIQDWSTWGPVVTCTCFCPVFTCALVVDPDDDYFSYYYTSQFGVIDNPTTDLSSQYQNSGTFNPTTDLSTIFTSLSSYFTSFSTFFSSFDFTSFTSGFSSFTSLFSSSSSSSSSSNSSSSSSDASVLSVSAVLISAVVMAM